MEYQVKKFNENMINKSYSSYVLGIDIGGTNTNMAIAGIKNNKPIFLFSLDYKSKNLNSLIPAVEHTITYSKENFKIKIDFACIGAAGVVSPDNKSVKLTNLNWNVSSEDLIKNTSLSSVFIINDFQAIGYGLNLLDLKNENDFFHIRAGEDDIDLTKSVKVIIGAGTGLGKSILNYDENYKAYLPIPSEGGHSDLPIQNDFEMQLADFIKKNNGISQPLNYEEVLSGRGIEHIYNFLRKTEEFNTSQYTDEIDNQIDKALLISKYKNQDETCRETFRLFTRFYARCAKNLVLDTLAGDGLYIAGGIAAKNKEIFTSKDFFEEFENAYRRSDFLKKVPISVILNYDISLYGACYAAMHSMKLLNEIH